MTSGRSENFGALAVIRFLYHFSKYYDLSLHKKEDTHRWMYFCDNQGVTSRLKWMQGTVQLHATERLMNDYDLRITILNTLRAMGPTVQLRHVKGNKQYVYKTIANIQIGEPLPALPADKTLNRQTQLNIYCDYYAKFLLRCTADEPPPTPFLPDAVLHIRIGGELVINHVPSHLRHASTFPAFQRYMENKFDWSPKTFALIDWQPIGTTLRYKPLSEQRQLQKFLHGWLPTNSKLHRITPSHGPTCPSCGQAEESNRHFLYCTNVRRIRIWKDMLTTLREYLKSRRTPPVLADLLCTALEKPASLSQRPPPRTATIYHALYSEQNAIGWNQLVYGRFTKRWSNLYTSWFEYNRIAPPKTGQTWAVGILRIIWKHIIDLWLTRNEDQHGRDAAEHERKLRHRLTGHVFSLYAFRGDLPEHSRHIYNMSASLLLQKSTRQIQAWIHVATPFIHKARKAAVVQLKESTHDIREFFPIQPD